jgi:hypothetical protein
MPGNNDIRWEVLAAGVLRTVSMPHAYALVDLDLVADVVGAPHRYLAPYVDARPVRVDRRLADGKTVHWREYELLIHHLPGQTYFTMGIPIVFASSPLSSTLGLPRRFAAGWSPAIRRIGRSSSPSVSIGHS